LSCLAAGLLTLAAGRPSDARAGTPDPTMVRVPAGAYQPFFKGKNGSAPIPVRSFLLDRAPVTRAEFAAFVAREPRWRRSRIKELFAEGGYLADWHGDQAPAATAAQPVTNVSWFAARAYCECEGKRLPSQSEWEWAAEADPAQRSPIRLAAADRAQPARGTSPTLRFAMGRGRVPGLGFGEVWEWTSDFNQLMVANPSPGDSNNSLFCGDGFRANDARDYAGFLRFSFRSSLKANYTLKNLGFRCAKDLPEDVQ
jgi:formylglycine-generating enzyme required for sulfatase activity